MMLNNPFVFVLGILALIFSIPLLAIWTEHRRRMAELTARIRTEKAPTGQVQDQLRDLGRQISDLRATATEFDLSFDTALQRMESRLNHMDERMKRLEQARGGTSSEPSEEARIGVR
jgi:septal ring factor EnvC (AmiA/AmiB activator)